MKYPYDIVSYVRNKTFSIEAHMQQEKDESPLKVFGQFSRFVFAVISDGKAATCNIHTDEVAALQRITDYAYNKQLEAKAAPAAEETNVSPAFTKRFMTGTLKGKTPVEVLAEYGDKGKEMLNNQYKFLKENLAKFPKNQELIDAIIEAGKVDPSEIEKAQAGTNAPLTVLEIGCRPLVRKTREDGKSFCYECKVTWDFTKNYPVSIQIKNYYAPVRKNENGMLNVMLREKDTKTEISNEFSMTAKEWINAVDSMKRIMDSFYLLNLKSALNMAERAGIENRQAAKGQSAQNIPAEPAGGEEALQAVS